MALKEQTFTKGGRTWRSVPTQDGNLIGLYYEDPIGTDFERVKNKTYPEGPGSPYAQDEIDPTTGKRRMYILHSGYRKNPTTGTWQYFTYAPGNESDNGNLTQANAIFADANLRRQLTDSSTNTTTTNPNQPSPDGPSSTPTSPPNENPKPAAQRLTYPSDMKGDQDRIMFHAHKYESGGRLGSKSLQTELTPVQYIPLPERVFLPIQASITDQNSVGWEPDTMNPIEIAAVNMSKYLMEADAGDIAGGIAGNMTAAILKLKENSEAVRTYLAGQAVGLNNLQSRLNGQVLNPNLELLFQGPQLRPFSFTFKMSARNQGEANEIKAIINYFKKNMAVRKDNAIFLKAPNVFKIQYQYGDPEQKKLIAHPGLNLIKMCALTNCSVDYTPLGTYMTFNDGTMMAYTMSLSFQELTPIYQDDYDTFKYGDGTTVPNHTIGG